MRSASVARHELDLNPDLILYGFSVQERGTVFPLADRGLGSRPEQRRAIDGSNVAQTAVLADQRRQGDCAGDPPVTGRLRKYGFGALQKNGGPYI
jgi:hypothetical protein